MPKVGTRVLAQTQLPYSVLPIYVPAFIVNTIVIYIHQVPESTVLFCANCRNNT